MAYVIQNVKTTKYLKHNGNYNPDAYHFKDVNEQEKAERYPSSIEHADTSQEFEIIEV
ncbi:hypothetical protein [Bacillus cereus]|uniref:hypothetical protein n=1 Tax=Bacillus cereus TaxID=1396 RepID=UPI0015CF31EA|nr:hypothetical protein [Bacillus cereus]